MSHLCYARCQLRYFLEISITAQLPSPAHVAMTFFWFLLHIATQPMRVLDRELLPLKVLLLSLCVPEALTLPCRAGASRGCHMGGDMMFWLEYVIGGRI